MNEVVILNSLAFIILLGVAVATAQKGERPLRSPFQSPERPLSENMNRNFEFTANACRYSSMKSGSLRHPWLSLTDTLQNGDSFTEMGLECLVRITHITTVIFVVS